MGVGYLDSRRVEALGEPYIERKMIAGEPADFGQACKRHPRRKFVPKG